MTDTTVRQTATELEAAFIWADHQDGCSEPDRPVPNWAHLSATHGASPED